MRNISMLLIVAGVLFAILSATPCVLCEDASSQKGQTEKEQTLRGAEGLAQAYGLDPSDIGSFNETLCARLIRHGKVYLHRGRFVEAKQTFLKAVLVDPSSQLAWRYYDLAVVSGLAARVEQNPGLLGLPGGDKPAPVETQAQEEEGC